MSVMEVGFASAGAEQELLLREFSHRTANEIAVAIGAMTFAIRGDRDPSVTRRTVGDAIDRLRCFGDLHRLLARPLGASVDLGSELVDLCNSIRGARAGSASSRVKLDVEPLVVDGAVGRRVLLVAAELTSNAFKYALDGRDGELAISLRAARDRIILVVADDGPGLGAVPASGTGYGSAIVDGLVAAVDGAVAVSTGVNGTRISVEFPFEEDLCDAA